MGNIGNFVSGMEAVMRADKFGRKGLTFSDVLLVPAYSEVLPGQVDVTTV